MADQVELVINVNEDAAVDSSSSIENKIKNSSAKPSDVEKLTKQAKQNMNENKGYSEGDTISTKGIKAFIANNVLKEAATMGIKVAEETASQSFKYGGNSAAMNKMNNSINKIKGALSIGTSIGGYATAGAAMGGPWGAAIGAVVGVIFTTVDSIISYNTNNAELQWTLQQERVKAEASAARLGISCTSRGRLSAQDFKL